jgi:hypothetical protein
MSSGVSVECGVDPREAVLVSQWRLAKKLIS